EWNDFVRGFSARNQFRLVVFNGNAIPKLLRETPLLYVLGVRYVRTSPEEVVEAYATRAHDPSIGFRAGSVRSPRVMALTQDLDGEEIRLIIGATGEKKMTLTLRGDLCDGVRRDVTAKIAYALFEREGRNHGRDFEHWGEAERIIRDLERMVNEGFV
ncbi:MAG: DUF2934 domain-containing protein, partial [Bacteroidota bacterium]